jgi:hypothetical protein
MYVLPNRCDICTARQGKSGKQHFGLRSKQNQAGGRKDTILCVSVFDFLLTAMLSTLDLG